MYLDKPIPLRGAGRRNRRRGPARSRGSGLIVVLVLGVVNYFLFFDHNEAPVDPTALAAAEVAPVNVTDGALGEGQHGDAPEVDDFGEPVGRTVSGKIARGQTVLRALKAEGIDSQTALPLVNAMGEVFDFKKAQVGDAFTARVNDEGQVTRFDYQQSPLDVYEVELDEAGTYHAKKRKVPTRIDIAHLGCAIKSTLYESLSRCGEGAQLAGMVIDLFAWDVDFFQDVREGDELRVMVEKISVDGRFLKYGKVLAAEYKGKFGQHRIIGYRDPDGNEGYFTADGRSVRKDFLKSPMKYTRVSSSGGLRKALKSAGPATYTAQTDTPVWAVGAGTVVFSGDSGSQGKTVTIRHENGYTSTYSHLGAISRGVQVGSFVSQKTILGKVGKDKGEDSAELVFSLRKNGRLMDPMKTRFTEGDPVAPEHKAHFDHEVEQILQDLQATPVIGVLERRS